MEEPVVDDLEPQGKMTLNDDPLEGTPGGARTADVWTEPCASVSRPRLHDWSWPRTAELLVPSPELGAATVDGAETWLRVEARNTERGGQWLEGPFVVGTEPLVHQLVMPKDLRPEVGEVLVVSVQALVRSGETTSSESWYPPLVATDDGSGLRYGLLEDAVPTETVDRRGLVYSVLTPGGVR